MKVYMKCFATLAKAEACNFTDSTAYTLDAGQRVEDLIDLAGINKADVKLAFVNHRKADLSSVLSDGDRIGLAPATAGM